MGDALKEFLSIIAEQKTINGPEPARAGIWKKQIRINLVKQDVRTARKRFFQAAGTRTEPRVADKEQLYHGSFGRRDIMSVAMVFDGKTGFLDQTI